jgi:hypothetical protein
MFILLKISDARSWIGITFTQHQLSFLTWIRYIILHTWRRQEDKMIESIFSIIGIYVTLGSILRTKPFFLHFPIFKVLGKLNSFELQFLLNCFRNCNNFLYSKYLNSYSFIQPFLAEIKSLEKPSGRRNFAIFS